MTTEEIVAENDKLQDRIAELLAENGTLQVRVARLEGYSEGLRERIVIARRALGTAGD